MLSSQLSRGLPLFLAPSVSPTVTAASIEFSGIRNACPKYANFGHALRMSVVWFKNKL